MNDDAFCVFVLVCLGRWVLRSLRFLGLLSLRETAVQCAPAACAWT